MKYTPHILGAVALVGIAGALSGATLGDSPVLTKGHSDTLPQTQMVTAANLALRNSSERPPDHYPLKTADGTIGVAELALHGRLRDRGGEMWWERTADEGTARMNAGYDFYDTASPERIAHEERLLAFKGERLDPRIRKDDQVAPSQPRNVTRAEAPMALAEPAELVTEPTEQMQEAPAGANSRIVHVAAELALRD